MTGKMTPRSFVARVRDLVPGVTQGEGTIFAALWQSRGRTVTYEVMADRFAMVVGDEITDESIRHHIKRLRPKLEAIGWPVELLTIYGTGYRLNVTDADPAFDPFVPGPDNLPTWVTSEISGNGKIVKFTVYRDGGAIAVGQVKVDRFGDIGDAVDALAAVVVPE